MPPGGAGTALGQAFADRRSVPLHATYVVPHKVKRNLWCTYWALHVLQNNWVTARKLTSYLSKH